MTPLLLASWAEAVDLDRLFAIPWNQSSPMTTPDGLADPTGAVAVLANVAAKVEATYGTLDVSWGQVFRLHSGNLDLLANGGPGKLGIFQVLDFAPSADRRFQSIQGDSYVAIIEFSNPVRAMSLSQAHLIMATSLAIP